MLYRIKRVLGNYKINIGPGYKSKFRQLVEMLWLALRYRFSPIEYRTYRFFDRDMKFSEMLTFLSNYEISYKIRPSLYDRRVLSMLNNKLLFNRYYSAYGLPLPRLYAFFHPDSGFTLDEDPMRNAEDFKNWLTRTGIKQFFIKPCGGKKGGGVIAVCDVKQADNGSYILTDPNDNTWKVEELAEKLSNQFSESSYPGYLIEEKIEQHPLLSQINSSSVNTCRLLTLVQPDNTITIPFAAFRFGRMGNTVDSWSNGGIAFQVNVETGELIRGSFHPDWGLTKNVSYHPDSRMKLRGLVVPGWNEIKDLVLKAAFVTPDIKSIGWDVAVSRKGVLLIEGNSLWSPLIFQGVCGGFLDPKNKEFFGQYQFNLRNM